MLEEEHGWLRAIAVAELRHPVHFWQKVEALPRVSGDLSASVRDALEHLLPERGLDYRVTRRIAGLWAAWAPPLVALADCHGAE